MTPYRYHALGPLLAGEGSRAFLGLAISPDSRARPVVIIWVPEAAEKDPALLEKIRRETEHAAKLDHPNIVTVMGFAKLEEGHARVVEFADGESLRKVIDAAKLLPPRIAARIVCDACTGVHYAHVAGNDDGSPLVHGDVRPETLLISFGGVTKVTGYGALAFAPREIGGQRVKGRRVHSAPEQIIAGREAITLPTDVYLLGLVLYECLTGVVPWADQGDYFDHAVLSLPLPPAKPGLIPEGLEPVIARACAKKASERYPTPLAMREAIEAAAPGAIATTEELTAFLDALFPQSHQLRADRRHTIDAGIADFVRRQWADQERRETMPMMRAVQLPVPAPAAPAPRPPAAPAASVPTAAPAAAPAPVHAGRPALPAPVHRPEPIDDDDERVPDEGSSAPWLILLAFFIAVVAGWWGWKKANEPIPGVDRLPTKPPVVAVVDAGAPPSPPSVDAGSAVMLDASVIADVSAPDAGATTEDAGTPFDAGLVRAPVDAGPAVVAAAEVAVSLDSTPQVEVVLDGHVLGKTPWSGHLPAGRKSFTLQNKELGLSAVKVLTLKAEPVSEAYTFEKGFVTINAPEGGVVFIDGVRIGGAPITGEVPVYEGFHRISVNVGQSKWTDTFTLFPGQRVRFNVTLEQ
jgi:serine/threonine-protein kinase